MSSKRHKVCQLYIICYFVRNLNQIHWSQFAMISNTRYLFVRCVKIFSSFAFRRNSMHFKCFWLSFAVALYACFTFINWILHKWCSHIFGVYLPILRYVACTCMSICHAISTTHYNVIAQKATKKKHNGQMINIHWSTNGMWKEANELQWKYMQRRKKIE